MQLRILHRTAYRYDEPVKYSAQALRLTPRREGRQRVLGWSMQAPGRRIEQVDAHGNVTHLLTVEDPHKEIEIIVTGYV
jgi:transglutaminase-like putative cysteine protease